MFRHTRIAHRTEPPPNEEQRPARPAELRALPEGLPDDETVLWRDAVQIHTNPKLGRMGMLQGQQAEVPTPGPNRNRHRAGSIHGRTGTGFLTEAAPKPGRNSAL